MIQEIARPSMIDALAANFARWAFCSPRRFPILFDQRRERGSARQEHTEQRWRHPKRKVPGTSLKPRQAGQIVWQVPPGLSYYSVKS